MPTVLSKYLPNELMLNLFENLDAQSVLACQYVNRQWNECANRKLFGNLYSAIVKC